MYNINRALIFKIYGENNYSIQTFNPLCSILHMQAQFCKDQGIGATDASRLYVYNGLASSILRALTGFVCNSKRVNPQVIMQISMVISGLSIIAPTFLSTYEQLLACFIVYGCADGAITSSMNILALSILSPEERCQGFGFFHCCLALAGGAAGPPFGGTFCSGFLPWLSVEYGVLILNPYSSIDIGTHPPSSSPVKQFFENLKLTFFEVVCFFLILKRMFFCSVKLLLSQLLWKGATPKE